MRLPRPVLVIAAVTFAVHAAVSGRYGFHRDELYVLATGRHPTHAYLPLLSRLGGHHLWPRRVLAGSAHAAVVVVAALVARELHGDRRAQTRTAMLAAVAPWYIVATALFVPLAFDALAGAVVVWLVIRAIRRHQTTAWLAAAAAVIVWVPNLRPSSLTIAVLIALSLLAIVAIARTRLAVPLVAVGVVSAVALLPVLPVRTMRALRFDKPNDAFDEELGWTELTDQVAAVYAGLDASERPVARILAGSKGEAAAIQWYGPARGIPADAVLSGHDRYRDWWPDNEPLGPVIAIRIPARFLEPYYRQVETVGFADNRYGIPNYLRGAPIVLCRGLKVRPFKIRDAFTRD